MARVSIYVSDELKARMAETGDALNWSDLARPAFETAIAAFNHRKGQNMQTAIERLRASKVKHEQELEVDGKAVGRAWALHHAEFAELKAVAEIDTSSTDFRPETITGFIKFAIDPQDNLSEQDVAESLFDDKGWPDETFLEAWIEGASEVFSEVEDKL